MKWSIGKGVNGVVTDDPKKYLEVCKNYSGEKVRLGLKTWGWVVVMNIFARLFRVFFRARFRGSPVNVKKIEDSMETDVEEEI